MYLSRLILNLRNRGVRRDLSAPHSLHQTLMRAFPDNLDQHTHEPQERVLYRVDQDRRGTVQCLVQSQLKPDWSYLQSNGFLLNTESENPEIKGFNLALHLGQLLAFRLRANPTKRLGKSAAFGKGKRVGLYKTEEQLDWLMRKAQLHGFHIETVMPNQPQLIQTQIPITADKQQSSQFHDARFLGVQFDGILRVTDVPLFTAAVNGGIGSGKAFGFGLLSIAPDMALD